MITVRIEKKPAFVVVGRKTHITGQDNEQFGVFWQQSHANGFIAQLKALRSGVPGEVTQSLVFGVSRCEADPANRAFDFYIAAEAPSFATPTDMERFVVPACTWAIFGNRGALPMSLIDAELECHLRWLPASGYAHALAPELEIYPAGDSQQIEYWLPICSKGLRPLDV